MKEYIILYQGSVLEEYLRVKNVLREHGIEYQEEMKRPNDSMLQFVALLFLKLTAAYGMNNERRQEYHIYVDRQDYEKAMRVLNL